MSALIEFRDVTKLYEMGDTTVRAADGISMKIDKGEFVAIVGQSGSGKSTCMNIIGCLDVPTSGTYLLDGRDVGQMDRDELAEIRNELLGFIFQQYNLLPKLDVLENESDLLVADQREFPVRQLLHVCAIQKVISPGGDVQTTQHIHHSGLTGAGLAHNG
ncbi:MAG: ATP-binding cassette domain-containing protein, partial [Oscillibacter sp.]|nr:ATP-binding cassette domain-containing protein [Oscillibacter sp.]